MAWTNKEKQNEYWKKYYQKNKEKLRLYKQKLGQTLEYKKKCAKRALKYYYQRKDKNPGKKLRLRFKILARDNFTCQYCGRKAPDVILQVDHIHPKSKGGLNRAENYITSCRDCNLGKNDSLL